ncbi:uncharacterized protein PAC_17691 [Phialocephala subalpina]|uniref:Uncharacterized protein n=1 Tax=Phialocephala subalpina TaxID=576137 RepID=A0A1L7XRV1_9HELO|nr:uncharacterized protein PAC_17691 [Phialocephala subalpina]
MPAFNKQAALRAAAQVNLNLRFSNTSRDYTNMIVTDNMNAYNPLIPQSQYGRKRVALTGIRRTGCARRLSPNHHTEFADEILHSHFPKQHPPIPREMPPSTAGRGMLPPMGTFRPPPIAASPSNAPQFRQHQRPVSGATTISNRSSTPGSPSRIVR